MATADDVAMEEQQQGAASSSDDGSESSSDSDVEEISVEAMQRLQALEAELEANANLYDKHIEVSRLPSLQLCCDARHD